MINVNTDGRRRKLEGHVRGSKGRGRKIFGASGTGRDEIPPPLHV